MRVRPRSIPYVLLYVDCFSCTRPHPGETARLHASAAANPASPQNLINIRATVAKSGPVSKSEVTIHLTMTSQAPFVDMEVGDFFQSYSPEVVSDTGVAQQYSLSGAQFYGAMMEGRHQRGIKEGKFTEEYDFAISRLYDLASPGVYKVRFFRQATIYASDPRCTPPPPEEFDGLIYSNTVLVEVK